uniref:Uncharacterized protein n=1 Tax=Rhizophora mucronata TaxID=61149 RepID=A0A2P2R1B8_RHIMU
MGWSSFFQL